MATRIALARERLERHPCATEGLTAPGCDWQTYALLGTDAVTRPNARPILIVDSFTPNGTFFRYANRIAGAYSIDGAGNVARTLGDLRFPVIVHDTLLEFASDVFVSSASLRDLFPPTYFDLRRTIVGHGFTVLRLLVDRAHESPLVLVNLEDALGGLLTTDTCARGVDLALVDGAMARARAQAAAIGAVMRQHQVQFVNASFGDTARTVSATWLNKCGTVLGDVESARRLLRAYEPIYTQLFATPGVFAAHAALQLEGDAQDHPYDVARPDFPNRLRVGFIGAPGATIEEDGTPYTNAIDSYPSMDAADLFIQYGCDREGECGASRMKLTGVLGVGTSFQSDPQPSWTAPLAVAWAVYEADRLGLPNPMSNEDVQALKARLAPPSCRGSGGAPCVFRDPVKYKLFPVCGTEQGQICLREEE